MNLVLGKMTTLEESIMEKALITTYSLKSITFEDDDIVGKEIPVMTDLQSVLETMDGADSLQKKLEKFTNGIFAGLFSKRTNVDL
jgi:hypothetical protein